MLILRLTVARSHKFPYAFGWRKAFTGRDLLLGQMYPLSKILFANLSGQLVQWHSEIKERFHDIPQ